MTPTDERIAELLALEEKAPQGLRVGLSIEGRSLLRAALLELQERRRKVQTVKHTDCLCCFACECGYDFGARRHPFCPSCGHEIDWGGK